MRKMGRAITPYAFMVAVILSFPNLAQAGFCENAVSAIWNNFILGRDLTHSKRILRLLKRRVAVGWKSAEKVVMPAVDYVVRVRPDMTDGEAATAVKLLLENVVFFYHYPSNMDILHPGRVLDLILKAEEFGKVLPPRNALDVAMLRLNLSSEQRQNIYEAIFGPDPDLMPLPRDINGLLTALDPDMLLGNAWLQLSYAARVIAMVIAKRQNLTTNAHDLVIQIKSKGYNERKEMILEAAIRPQIKFELHAPPPARQGDPLSADAYYVVLGQESGKPTYHRFEWSGDRDAWIVTIPSEFSFPVGTEYKIVKEEGPALRKTLESGPNRRFDYRTRDVRYGRFEFTTGAVVVTLDDSTF